MSSTLTRKPGQRVLLQGGKFHGAARITKINPKNIIVTMEGTLQRVNCNPVYLSDLAEDAPVPGVRALVEVSTTPHVVCGSFVTYAPQPGKVFVVLADKVDKINIALAGGDRDRYWRAPRSLVTPLTVAEAARLLA